MSHLGSVATRLPNRGLSKFVQNAVSGHASASESDGVKPSRCSTCTCSADRGTGSCCDVEWWSAVLQAHSALKGPSPNSAAHCQAPSWPAPASSGGQLRAAPVGLVLMQSMDRGRHLSSPVSAIHLSPTSACSCRPASSLLPDTTPQPGQPGLAYASSDSHRAHGPDRAQLPVLFAVIRPRDRARVTAPPRQIRDLFLFFARQLAPGAPSSAQACILYDQLPGLPLRCTSTAFICGPRPPPSQLPPSLLQEPVSRRSRTRSPWQTNSPTRLLFISHPTPTTRQPNRRWTPQTTPRRPNHRSRRSSPRDTPRTRTRTRRHPHPAVPCPLHPAPETQPRRPRPYRPRRSSAEGREPPPRKERREAPHRAPLPPRTRSEDAAEAC